MKRWLDWAADGFEHAAKKYGLTIFAFLFGVPFGAALMTAEVGHRLDLATAVGSTGAAFAAFIAVVLTLLAQKRQAAEKAEQQKPNLIVSWARGSDLTFFEFKLSNLGQYPVYIRTVQLVTYLPQTDFWRIPVDVLLSEATSMPSPYSTGQRFWSYQAGEIHLLFQYGATGTMYHRVAFPFDRHRYTEGGELKETLMLWLPRQTLTLNIGTEQEIQERSRLFMFQYVFDPNTREPLNRSSNWTSFVEAEG